MTLVQLEYILALSQHKHFSKAAQHCKVSQPTLSMQIQKLEEEMDIVIFDRSKQPIELTPAGIKIIEQIKKIAGEKRALETLIEQERNSAEGILHLGIIPTLAPYLLPYFVQKFITKYPTIHLVVSELNTQNIITQLKDRRIDLGILTTPLYEDGLVEEVLFYEELMAYLSKKYDKYHKTFVDKTDINPEKLWVLDSGHCFRSQVMNLCELRKNGNFPKNFEYAAGSIETLKKMVDTNDGITILPEMATLDFTPAQLQRIRYFKSPSPVREISIVHQKGMPKRKLVELLKDEILAVLPEKIKKNKKAYVVAI